jgi:hypothetical protein
MAMTSRMRRVKVAQIVLVHDGQAARGGQPGGEERLRRQLRALQHLHPGQGRHPLEPAGPGRHDRGDV